MKNMISPSKVTFLALIAMFSYASAQLQLDTRVQRNNYYNPRGGSDMGHALDRNPLLGSGGRNSGSGSTQYSTYTQNPDSFTDITRSRGLSNFHGNAPSINDTFYGNSSTFGTNDFDRRAVSVADVVGNPTSIYNPKNAAPFYGQGETTMTLGQVERANILNVAPIPGNSNPTVDIARQNSMNELTNEMNTPQYNRVVSTIMLQNTPYSAQVAASAPGTLPSPTNPQDILELQRALDRVGYSSGSFGVTNPYQQTTLANEISQFDSEEDQINQQNGMVNARIDSNPIASENSVASIQNNPITGKPPVREDFLYTEQPAAQTASDVQGGIYTAQPSETTTAGFNQDAFSDLRTALQKKAVEERNAKEKQRKEAMEKQSEELEKVIDKNYEKNAEDEELNDLSLQHDKELRKQMIVTLDKTRNVVLKNLAGNSKDLFNRYMNNAKRALAKGRYYAASQQYELAAITNSRNPLPWLGGSLAKFAACEWSVAGFRLQTAMETYPQLMEVKLDLKSLLPNMNVQQQLNLLENWLIAITPQPNVLVLAAYMQYQAGNIEGARRHAQAILNYPSKVAPIIKYVAEEIMKKTAPKK